MSNYEKIDFKALAESTNEDVITYSRVRDVKLPSGKNFALITLDNDRDHNRPNTLGPATMIQLGEVLDDLKKRAKAGEIAGVGITGKPFILAAGADLSQIQNLKTKDQAMRIAQLGHYVLGKLDDLGVPSFCFINGLALGGGLEIALNSNYRTIDSSAAAIALPEVFLGIIPGWGGAYLLPNLIGIENALKVIIENPLKQNRMLKPADALSLGIADVMFSPARFLEDSLKWADGVISGKVKVKRPNEPGSVEKLAKWDIAINIARKSLEGKIGKVAKSPYAALDLIAASKKGTKAQGFEREDEVLSELIAGDQFAASLYAFDLVQKRAKRPAGDPGKELAQPVTRVGIIGAGLMASQFALLFVRRLQVPVIITDLDQERVDKGLAYIREELGKLLEKGRINQDDFNRFTALVSGTTDKADFAGCDWVIEAVFEDTKVKQQVFGEIEPHLSETAIIATNTSSLSVTEIASGMKHPERVVGFHFFNPVAVMPLVEVVKAEKTNDVALATAFATARALKKTAVFSKDAPGFIVNRLLAKVMGEAARAADLGTPISVVETSLAPLGLPMGPFELIDLVGWAVAAHVQDTMVRHFPDRFYASENLHTLASLKSVVEKDKHGKVVDWSKEAKAALKFGNTPMTGAEILARVEDELAKEIKLMLDEGVTQAAEDVDLGLILGAGYPFIDGGITPYLDRVGASERVNGATFHNPPIKGIN